MYSSHHPSKAMVAGGEGGSHSGSSAGSGKLRKEADIRTGSPKGEGRAGDAPGPSLYFRGRRMPQGQPWGVVLWGNGELWPDVEEHTHL